MALMILGTKGGVYLLKSDAGRTTWTQTGPFLKGQSVGAVAVNNRNGVTLLAGSDIPAPSFPPSPRKAGIYASSDLGATWSKPQPLSIVKVWTIEPAPTHRKSAIYAGTEPASVFYSPDGGATWMENEALAAQRIQEKWPPGGGGLCLNSIILDESEPKRMWCSVSVGGVRHTSDGGKTWRAVTNGMTGDCPDRGPEEKPEMHDWIHGCIHHLSAPRGNGNRIYQKNHCGTYRTDDGGAQWVDISAGLPWRGGFPLVADAHLADRVYIIPAQHGKEGFNTPRINDALCVYRSDDAGRTWTAFADGLPDTGEHHIYRDAMTTDGLKPSGIYFGTKAGSVYASTSDGTKWQTIAGGLPAIMSVRCAEAA